MEIKYFEKGGGYTFFHLKMNEEILEKLGACLIENRIPKYKSKWLNHDVSRLETSGFCK